MYKKVGNIDFDLCILPLKLLNVTNCNFKKQIRIFFLPPDKKSLLLKQNHPGSFLLPFFGKILLPIWHHLLHTQRPNSIPRQFHFRLMRFGFYIPERLPQRHLSEPRICLRLDHRILQFSLTFIIKSKIVDHNQHMLLKSIVEVIQKNINKKRYQIYFNYHGNLCELHLSKRTQNRGNQNQIYQL